MLNQEHCVEFLSGVKSKARNIAGLIGAAAPLKAGSAGEESLPLIVNKPRNSNGGATLEPPTTFDTTKNTMFIKKSVLSNPVASANG
jgi:hypothetical protein